MKATDINTNKTILNELISKAINDSIDLIISNCKALKTKAQEPDFIAGLTLAFTPQLYRILKLVFPLKSFSVTGIFCHQSPIVNVGTLPSPEIGDILIVYIYTDSKGNKTLNSLLLQAKISKRHTLTIPKKDSHQLNLYLNWPKFTYISGSLRGKTRDIVPKTINNGAQYLLIDYKTSVLKSISMLCANPSATLYPNNDLTSEIIELVKFKSGRIFEEDPSKSSDDWTKMIWDIIKTSRSQVSKRINSNLIEFPRQVVDNFDGLCYFDSDTESILKDLHNFTFITDKSFVGAKKNEKSVSLILLECDEQKVK